MQLIRSQQMLLRNSLILLLLMAFVIPATSTQKDGQCGFDAADVTQQQQQQHSTVEQQQHEAHRKLMQTAQLLVAPGKGILAADESTATMGRR